ncbi:thiolase family protein [Dehalococcoidia bacterium]|nr:thiolase family protein [Dehalococcoidia bacterium]
MAIDDVRDKACIVGIGQTKVDRDPTSSQNGHLAQAMKLALDDAGLSPDDIDGIVPGSVPQEASMDQVGELFGFKNIRYAFQHWSHGRMEATKIAHAALAVHSGMCDYLLYFSGSMWISGFRNMYAGSNAGMHVESLREGTGPHLESPPYGNVAIQGGAAIAMSKYLHKYGYSEEQLGAVAVALRKWGSLNPNSYWFGKPITIEDYINARYITQPLRLYDCSLPGNAGFCMIITTPERAKALRKPPAYISGFQGSISGADHFVFSRTGLGIWQQPEFEYEAPEMLVYKMAGVQQSDIDVLGVLDVFSTTVVFALEEFGFCKDGEALGFVQNGRIEPGGELPINTGGGGLGHVNAAGRVHMTEMVMQLRGEAGERQVPNARAAQYIATDRSSIILTRR